jgi:alpha-L-rhamnosidase
LSELNTTFARTSYAMTRGRHAADVAWLYPELDYRDGVSALAGGAVPRSGESATSRAILEAGYIYDRISRSGLTTAQLETDAITGRGVFRVGQATYRSLFIEDLKEASPELLAAVSRIEQAGIPVVVLGELPSRARGWADHERRDEAVRLLVAELASNVTHIDSSSEFGTALKVAGILPTVESIDGEPLAFSPERRTTPGGDVVLLFNESNADVTQRLQVNLAGKRVRVYDPELSNSIKEIMLPNEPSLELEVPARRWRILVVDQ